MKKSIFNWLQISVLFLRTFCSNGDISVTEVDVIERLNESIDIIHLML